MRRYLARKLLIYLLTFFVAVTIDWAIPRLMPGDPVSGLIARAYQDRFALTVSGGNIVVDTGLLVTGPPIGTNTTNQSPEGAPCV